MGSNIASNGIVCMAGKRSSYLCTLDRVYVVVSVSIFMWFQKSFGLVVTRVS